MRTFMTLILLVFLVFLPALPVQAQLSDLDNQVQNEQIQAAPSCSGGICPGGTNDGGSGFSLGSAASLVGGLANSCSGGGGGFLSGIMDFFKQLFGGIVDFFRGIFGGGNNGGGGFTPPIDNGGGFTPPVDTGTTTPPVAPPTTPVTPPTTPGTDTAGNPPTTSTPPTNQPPMDLSDLEKKAGLIEYKPTKNFNSSSSRMLNDIESHIALKHGTQYRDSSKSTWAHETTHGINSDIRNGVAAKNLGSYKVNGFYLGNNKAYIMKEFNLRKRHAAPYIPMSLRSSRYNLYIAGQTAWDDTPSYIIDEWVSYTNGAITGLELAKQGQIREHTDGAKGALEFTFYSLGLAMAVEKQDPGRFDEQFKAFMALEMKRAMAVFLEAKDMPNFSGFGQNELLQSFLGGSDSAAMRDFVKRIWGEAFFKEVFVR